MKICSLMFKNKHENINLSKQITSAYASMTIFFIIGNMFKIQINITLHIILHYKQ